MKRAIRIGIWFIAVPVILVVGFACLYIFVFGVNPWTLDKRIQERKAFLDNRNQEYFKTIANGIAELIDEANRNGELHEMYSDDFGESPIPDAFRSLKPRAIAVNPIRNSAIIYLEKTMDTGAILYVRRSEGELTIEGSFGEPGREGYVEKVYFKSKQDTDGNLIKQPQPQPSPTPIT
jgi:hypothetical protein